MVVIATDLFHMMDDPGGPSHVNFDEPVSTFDSRWLLDLLLIPAKGNVIVGVSEDGRIDYSRELTAGEQATADAVVEAHNPDGLLPWEEDEITAKEAKQNFRNMPQWATMTPQEADQYIADNVNDLASAKVVLRKMGKMLMFLRDVAIRRVD